MLWTAHFILLCPKYLLLPTLPDLPVCLPACLAQILDGDKYLWQALGSGLWPVMVLVSEIVQVGAGAAGGGAGGVLGGRDPGQRRTCRNTAHNCAIAALLGATTIYAAALPGISSGPHHQQHHLHMNHLALAPRYPARCRPSSWLTSATTTSSRMRKAQASSTCLRALCERCQLD